MVIDGVEYNQIKSLMELAEELGVEYEEFEGTLLFNYIFHSNRKIDIEGKVSKYIIAQETYKNSNESIYTVILTNDEDKMFEYLNLFDPYDEEED